MCRIKLASFLFITFAFYSVSGYAQQVQNKTLFTAGYASAFIGGLYNGFYPYSELKQHGNFGLGAPDKLDGELLMFNGVLYQTEASGKTFEVTKPGLTPFAVVCSFKADKVMKITAKMNKAKLFAYLDSVMPNQNAVYALHIKGWFKLVKTRAYPMVVTKPYIPMAAMLYRQHFFTFNDASGDLVGYRIPAYMEGANISGYHFHFLSENKKGGGHIVDLETDKITIEIDRLDSFTVTLPQTKEFELFDFKKDRHDELKQVENGKKN